MINSCAAIVIAAKHGELTKVRDCEGITYTVGTLRCKFDFRTTDWNYTTRTAVFCKGNVATSPNISDKAIGVLLDNVDECAVPPEVLLPDEKYFSVGVWGVTAEGLRIVSEWLVYRIKDGCYVNSSESIPPTPTVYEQIITQINSKAPIEHEHTDKYYSKEDIDKKIENIKTEIEIPTKVSELENDRGYITDYIETDPTVPEWAKNKNKPTYTASEVGADPKGSAANALGDAKQYIDNKISAIDLNGKISAHNTNTSAHNDIRLKIQAVADKLNTFLDADDTTLDQMSEIVTYIKSNKELIESVTTSKVNVGDIVDNLITTTSNKPLSAKQGAVLKSLIDTITIPSNISELKNDVGYLKEYIETDPTVPSWAKEPNKPSYTANEVGALPSDTIIPSKVSQLDNDKGYLTEHQDISTKADKSTTLAGYGIIDAYTKDEVNAITGDIDTALDGIIAIQNTLIGGGSE